MERILFVCHGNICRSPMAEFVLKDMVKKKGMANQFEIASAATSTEEIWNGVGNPMYPPAKEQLAIHGILCEERQATQLKKSDYQYYDYLIGMDEKNMRNMEKITGQKAGDKMFMLLDLTGEHRSVADPWYSRDFQATYRDVVKGCIALLDRLQQQNG